jgi:hypothetical protein
MERYETAIRQAWCWLSIVNYLIVILILTAMMVLRSQPFIWNIEQPGYSYHPSGMIDGLKK